MLPWRQSRKELENRIEQLEKKVEKLNEEKESWKKRYRKEEERRKELSRKKQGAQEELNRLKDSLNDSDNSKKETQEKDLKSRSREIGFENAMRILEKLESVDSPENDLVTVSSPGKIGELDIKALKNSVSKNQFNLLKDKESFLAFIDQDLFEVIIDVSPFFTPELEIEKGFIVGEILEFIESEKHFVLVKAGETEIFREKNGRYDRVERITGRVNSEHGKGGFSQDRFERKRDEQIQNHLDQVDKKIEELEEVYLLGNQKMCSELEGEYLGGFDPNRNKPGQFYKFQLTIVKT